MMSQNSSPWIVLMAIMIISINAHSQTPGLFNSTLGNGGSSRRIAATGNSFLVQQSIGQSSVVGTFTKNGHSLRQGFIQPHILYSAERKNDLSLDVTVYPNPFTDKLTLSLPESGDTKIQIQISDLQGRIILHEEREVGNDMVLHSESLSSGQYILKINKGNKLSVIKLVKI